MEKRRFCIGVDLMGADIDPPCILHAITELPPETFIDTQFVLFGTHEIVSHFEKVFNEELKELPISFYPCKHVIEMKDDPMRAVRRKSESSLVRAVQELADKKLDALISCANTGALVLASCLHLNLLEGVHKPALVASIPTAQGPCVVLDVGAFPGCREKELVQLAYLGSAYASCMHSIKKPRVGLLNIGVEFGKGTEELYQANVQLASIKKAPFSFLGNIEPWHVFEGEADVVITPGFTGNIFLKTAEAVARQLLSSMEARGVTGLDELKTVYSQDDGAGALLIGVNGFVCKCHGNASIASVQKAALATKAALQKDLLEFTKRNLLTRLCTKSRLSLSL